MARDFYGGPHDVAVQEIGEMIAANRPYYSGVRVRTVKGMASGEWRHVLTIVQPFPEDIAPGREPSRRYPNALLLEDWFEPDQLAPFFIGEVLKKRAKADGELLDPAGDGGLKETETHPGRNPYSEYPGRLYRTVGGSDLVLSSWT